VGALAAALNPLERRETVAPNVLNVAAASHGTAGWTTGAKRDSEMAALDIAKAVLEGSA
jgi:hypothetical protein